MNTQATIDQIQYIFTFPFKDEKWGIKFLIAFVFYIGSFIIPVIPLIFVFGYVARIIENVIKENDFTLPEWDDWGDLAIKGLKIIGVSLIVAIPMLIFYSLGFISMFFPMFAFSGDNEGMFAGLFMMGMFSGMCLFGIGTIIWLVVSVFLPPAISHMIAEDSFGAAFHVSAWWRNFKANLGGYLIAYVLLVGILGMMYLGFYLMYMTFILCWLLPFIVSAFAIYAGFVAAALFGQAYRVGKENLELGESALEEAAA
jgi:MFS family permease